MAKHKLTTRQQKFVAAYDGNATKAAKLAGYTGSQNVLGRTGFSLLRHPIIRAAIDRREEGAFRSLILTREERQQLWSSMACDETLDSGARLRASELLGKSQGDFIERLEVKGELTLLDLVLAARKPKAGE